MIVWTALRASASRLRPVGDLLVVTVHTVVELLPIHVRVTKDPSCYIVVWYVEPWCGVVNFTYHPARLTISNRQSLTEVIEQLLMRAIHLFCLQGTFW